MESILADGEVSDVIWYFSTIYGIHDNCGKIDGVGPVDNRPSTD